MNYQKQWRREYKKQRKAIMSRHLNQSKKNKQKKNWVKKWQRHKIRKYIRNKGKKTNIIIKYIYI